VGKSHTGKGIASKALKQMLERVSHIGIEQLLAKTTNDNIPSQNVLIKNGFKLTKKEDESFEMNGRKLTFYHYKWCSSVSL
ncbi:GNAT family N-acetyltransferase, partial [Pseudomonas sp. 2822-15]|uniref:GNAT family N-acetyltransferase n=1 Tax=Pseudomonas sp. 2822-15 TaxID=1712677 RepID=UPI001179FE55